MQVLSHPTAVSAPAAAAQRRLRAAARPCHPRPARRLARALRPAAYRDGREEELSAKGQQPRAHEQFKQLASQVAGSLAAELASNAGSSDEDSTYAKLEKWLVGSHDESGELAPRSDQTTEESDAKKLIRQAAETFGMPTTVGDAVTSVQHWLSNPSGAEEGHDVQMVARLLHRLLQAYEQQTGRDFEGAEEGEYDQLHALASRVLGSSLPRDVLTRLVRSYLHL